MNMPSSARTANQAAMAVALKSNQLTAAYFAASILGLMAIITISHWAGEFIRVSLPKNDSPSLRTFISTAR